MARLRKRRAMNQINVVPYIDVTLVLLVIFMVTAPMTNPGVVELPKVGSEILKQQTVPIVITVMPNGKIEFQEKQMRNDELLFEIKKQVEKEPDRAFVISADKKVNYEEVVNVLAMLKKTGAKAGLLLNPAN
ncbi:MAG: protein TolR [Methylophilaceae bacterium]|nr:protein TolR [Methylophilaceae bacterium]